MNSLERNRKTLFIWASAAFLLAGCNLTASTIQDATDQFGAAIVQAGFTPEMPPTTKVRPGLVFAVEKDANGNPFRRTLCKDLGGGAALQMDNQVPMALAGTLTTSGSVGASLSEQWLGVPGTAAINASAKDVTSVSFTPAGPKTWEMAGIPLGQSTRVIPPDCKAMLQTAFDAQGNATKKVYLVVGALSYDSLTATYSGQGGPSFSAQLSAATTANANIGASAQSDGSATIKFAAAQGQSMYFGTNIVSVPTLAFLNSVGVGQKARVRLVAVAPSYPSPLSELAIR